MKSYNYDQVKYGLLISLAGFAITINVLPVMVAELIVQDIGSVKSFGIIFSLQFLCFATASALFGYLTNRGFKRHKEIIYVSLIVSSLVLFFLGLFLNAQVVFIGMLIIGFCGGSIESSSTMMLAKYDKSDHGRMIQFSQFFYCIGAVVVPVLVGFFFGRDSSVSFVFYIVAVFLLLLTIIIIILFHSQNKHSSYTLEQTPVTPEIQQSGIIQKQVKGLVFIFFLLSMFLYVCIEASMISWFPYYLESHLVIPTSLAAQLFISFWLGMAISRILFTLYQCKAISRWLIVCSAAICVLLLLVTIIQSIISYRVVLLLIGLSCGPIWALLVIYTKLSFRNDSLLFYMVGIGSVGACLGPLVSSRIIQYFQISKFPFFLIIISILMLFMFIILFGKTRD